MTYYWNRKTCAFCGREFRASRSDAKFCGSTCRKSHSRRKENVLRAVDHAGDNLRWMVKQAELHPDLALFIRQSLIDVSGEALQLARQVEKTVTPATVTDNLQVEK